MKTVVVVMSAYNGEKYIRKQLDSILAQRGVEVKCFVRDDGSTDSTAEILEEYAAADPRVTYIKGENEGWERSFMDGLRVAPEGDYYAFSDQDDIWFKDKLSAAVEMLAGYGDDEVVMYHGNKLSTDEELHPYRKQIVRVPRPLNRRNAFVQEFAQGCSIVMTKAAREMVLRFTPTERVAHDFWCGFVCYMTGKVIYDRRPHFYHITHGNNASGEGHKIAGWKRRFKMIKSGDKAYYLPLSFVTADAYADYLTDDDRRFANRLKNYRNNAGAKLSLLFSPKFRRSSLIGTLSLKTAVLLNKL